MTFPHIQMEAVCLLPDHTSDDGFKCFPGATFLNEKKADSAGVDAKGYVLWASMDRLDFSNYPFYCFLTKGLESTVKVYKHKLTTDLEPQLFEQDENIICATESCYNSLSMSETLIHVETGDWLSCKKHFHSIAALSHLGIIEELQPKLFDAPDFEKWENMLNERYGTFGPLDNVLKSLYQTLVCAIEFFGLGANPKFSGAFVFGDLLKCLENSRSFRELKLFFPKHGKTPLETLHRIFTWTVSVLNLGEEDITLDKLNAAMTSFRTCNGLSEGDKKWDVDVCRKIAKKVWESDPPQLLPILKMAHIDFSPIMQQRPERAQLVIESEKGLENGFPNEIQEVVSCLFDPTKQVDWMASEVAKAWDSNTSWSNCRRTTQSLSSRIANIENQVNEIEKRIQATKTILHISLRESKSASSQVEMAGRTLTELFHAHTKMKEESSVLRDKIYLEQSSSRLILVIAIILTFAAALHALSK